MGFHTFQVGNIVAPIPENKQSFFFLERKVNFWNVLSKGVKAKTFRAQTVEIFLLSFAFFVASKSFAHVKADSTDKIFCLADVNFVVDVIADNIYTGPH